MRPLKSTRWPSNSGPSTQANFVSSPTVTRQPPHMPVPSTMIGFSDTTVLMPRSRVASATLFIMMTGPMAVICAIFSPRSTSACTAFVTKPLMPREPSSVVTTISSVTSRISSSMMRMSFVFAPMIAMTLLPASFIARAIGNVGATPMPPPTTTIVPSSLPISDGRPSGPTKSRMSSPSFNAASSIVDAPMTWNTMRMRPISRSKFAIVSGMRSPSSLTRSTMNCPGSAFFATRGASISIA